MIIHLSCWVERGVRRTCVSSLWFYDVIHTCKIYTDYIYTAFVNIYILYIHIVPRVIVTVRSSALSSHIIIISRHWIAHNINYPHCASLIIKLTSFAVAFMLVTHTLYNNSPAPYTLTHSVVYVIYWNLTVWRKSN